MTGRKRDPDRSVADSSRRVRRKGPAPGCSAAALFVVLLVAVSYIPYASQHAMEQTALDREKARHELLVSQIARRVESQGRHLVETLVRVSGDLATMPEGDPHGILEIKGTWRMLRSFIDVDGMALIRCSMSPVTGYGVVYSENLDVWSMVAGTADLALRSGLVTVSDIWSAGGLGLHLTAAAPVMRDGVARCVVVATVNLERMIDRLFQTGAKEYGVSFTVMSSNGVILRHSGMGRPVTEKVLSMNSGTCNSCHEDIRVQEKIRRGRSGGGIFRIAGQDRVVAFSPVTIGNQVWSISASTLVSEVLRPVAQQNIVSIFFTLAVVIMLVTLGLMLRHGQIRSIRLEEKLATQGRMLTLAREKERLGKELEASRRMATVGEMVARVAHEVKNPLQYIGTAVDLLGTDVSDEDRLTLVEDIRTGVRSMDSIVKELLDFSRPMLVERVPVDINELVAEVAGRVVPEDIAVELDLDPGLALVGADGYKLGQVLENLLRNAMEARVDGNSGTQSDTFRIRVSTKALDRGRFAGGVKVTVEDNGMGMEAGTLSRIWEPFYTSKTRGSGLGLPVVRRILEAHGGEVRVDSAPGRGTSVEFMIPCADEAPGRDE
ncbi:MAG: hypothetical protein GXP54_10920 [Deltaproteobacteria bacterium]|nr:hypothetical protein [Deltaproteobacteria bacterium]